MKKNVWIFNHYASDMYENQGGRHFKFAENLLKKGFSPIVFCANTFHSKDGAINTHNKKCTVDTAKDIPFVFIKTALYKGNGFDRVKNMVTFYKNLFPTAKYYAENYCKPDIILASSVHPLTLVAGIRIAKKFHVPCICEIRDLWPEAIFALGKIRENSLIGKLLECGERWIYEKANSLIFTKEGDVDHIKEKKWDKEQGGKIDLSRCFYINNGVDIESFDEQVERVRLEDDDLERKDSFNVVYAGAIRLVNNVGNLLECAKLLKNYTNIKFLIYGDGTELGTLRRRQMEEHIDNAVFKGCVDKKYIPYILSKSSLNILNYSENMFVCSRGNSSNKLFEYMASEKPVISTLKWGYSIIEKYDCGIELEDSSPEVLAEAILKIYNMPESEYDRMGTNAKNGVKNFDFAVLTNKLIEVIDKI
ncbi:glycosyltransferase WbuB [Clostridia bacterium]|nr:glycosyltransferase WbuB [Clostridia bacterium]